VSVVNLFAVHVLVLLKMEDHILLIMHKCLAILFFRQLTDLSFLAMYCVCMWHVVDGAVKTFEADTGKPMSAFFEHTGWVTEFISWFVCLFYLQNTIHSFS